MDFKDLSDNILDECLSASLRKLKLDFTPTSDQQDFIFNLVKGKDVLVSLPMGWSLCYTVLLKARLSTEKSSTIIHSSLSVL